MVSVIAVPVACFVLGGLLDVVADTEFGPHTVGGLIMFAGVMWALVLLGTMSRFWGREDIRVGGGRSRRRPGEFESATGGTNTTGWLGG